MNMASMQDNEDERLARLVAESDIIYGCKAIAEVLRMDETKCFHFLKTGKIRGVVKIGRRYSASKRELLRGYLADVEG